MPSAAKRVLDLGCSSGALGAALKAADRSRHVVGVEVDARYAEVARQRLDVVIEDDLECLSADPSLSERVGPIDLLIAGDVLEHLRDPWSALERCAALLPVGGEAIVSLPNVRYWETFWQLGRHGVWPLRGEGIFDRTHLRWFTLANAQKMLDDAGLELTGTDRLYRLRPSGSRIDRHLARLERTPLRPFLTYQYVLVARRR